LANNPPSAFNQCYVGNFQKTYKSIWEEQREKGFELGLDTLSILAAKTTRDLASDVSDQTLY